MFLTVMTYKTPSRGLLSPSFTVACGDAPSASHVSDISGSSTGGAALVAAGPTGWPIHHHGRVCLRSKAAVWGHSACAEPRGWPGRPGGHLQLRVQVSVLPRGRPLQLNRQEVSRGNFGFYLTWEIVPFLRLSLRTSRGWVDLGNCSLFEVELENQQGMSFVIQHHPWCAIGRLLRRQCLKNLAFSRKAACST